ncbi:MAG: hypothetical protein ABIP03_01140 [Aquihabitans sp.]
MTPEQFLTRCPSLWHVAPSGSWATIEERGLRTAAQLIDAADLDAERRAELHELPRRSAVPLRVDGADVVLRDQGPLFKANLASFLEPGLTVADWVGLLNRRVYLFTNKAAMQKLLAKYVATDGAQDVISFSPRRLLETAHSRIELAARNTGAIARQSDPYKGRDTFLSISRSRDRQPAEVTMVDGLDDLSAVVRVERHSADGTRTALV